MCVCLGEIARVHVFDRATTPTRSISSNVIIPEAYSGLLAVGSTIQILERILEAFLKFYRDNNDRNMLIQNHDKTKNLA